MKISEKLRLRLNKELNLEIPDSDKFRRIYSGHWQRSAGAWSWAIGFYIGSQFNMKDLLKSEYLITFNEYGNDISILPANKDEYDRWVKNN